MQLFKKKPDVKGEQLLLCMASAPETPTVYTALYI